MSPEFACPGSFPKPVSFAGKLYNIVCSFCTVFTTWKLLEKASGFSFSLHLFVVIVHWRIYIVRNQVRCTDQEKKNTNVLTDIYFSNFVVKFEDTFISKMHLLFMKLALGRTKIYLWNRKHWRNWQKVLYPCFWPSFLNLWNFFFFYFFLRITI